MCGIAGIINFKKPAEQTELKSICDKISKRGPDAEGFFLENGIGLGHRRLSIIDLETGDQPMLSRDKNIVLVFNGEIYNFQELRKELASEGLEFLTRSDTEVVIQGYVFWGMQGLLERLEGMFAFALYDKKVRQVFIARDKFGEKPLYYYNNSEIIVFASELKAIEDIPEKKVINKEALNLFLSLSYIPAPFTIYEDVKKLVQANYMAIDLDGKIATHQYYNLKSQLSEADQYKTFEDASEHLRSLLFESVEKRMVADVPLGAFLSGGIDSSIITAIMATLSKEPVKTFSIGFTVKEYDESDRADLLAKHIGANHTLHYLDYRDVLHLVDDIIDHFDEPFGDSSAIPSFYVAQLARKDVKVVLTGDCADELFGGYEKYLAGYYSEKYKKLPSFLRLIIRTTTNAIPHTRWTNSLLRRIKKVILNADAKDFDLHYQYMCLGFSDEERRNLLGEDQAVDVKNIVRQKYEAYENGNALEKGFYTDLTTVLEGDMLVKVDRMCMKNSLEARVPFLDSNIVKAAYSMPMEYKINGRNKKYILKKTFQDLLPASTLKYRKKGFGVPVDYWFNHELKEQLDSLLDVEMLKKQGLFDVSFVQKLLLEHRSGKANHKGKLWNLFVFQKWYKAKMI